MFCALCCPPLCPSCVVPSFFFTPIPLGLTPRLFQSGHHLFDHEPPIFISSSSSAHACTCVLMCVCVCAQTVKFIFRMFKLYVSKHHLAISAFQCRSIGFCIYYSQFQSSYFLFCQFLYPSCVANKSHTVYANKLK